MLDPNNKEMSKLITTQITEPSTFLWYVFLFSVALFFLWLCIPMEEEPQGRAGRFWVVTGLVSAIIAIISGIIYFLTLSTSAGEMREALGIVNSDTKITIPTEEEPVALLNVEVREGSDTVHYDYVTLVRDGDMVTLVPNER